MQDRRAYRVHTRIRAKLDTYLDHSDLSTIPLQFPLPDDLLFGMGPCSKSTVAASLLSTASR